MLLWLIAVLVIPVITGLVLFLSLAEDFWQLITFRLDISRIFGDLFHVGIILLLGVGFEIFALYELVRHLL